ncbi:hypothetical protein PMAYCL1PPCAC_27257 [Pristionchus mayeri]|uniref:Uncharacterized protein n=1 Tax=Pristionchus mayeri TaxID=1317129 RepID=A0AAN5D6Q1_9BILA|nr:hypothetical protein PMAYCL1PPCAC_27257 [Pristionchus mayeri]
MNGTQIPGKPLPKLETCAKFQWCCTNTLYVQELRYVYGGCSNKCINVENSVFNKIPITGLNGFNMTGTYYCRSAVGPCQSPPDFTPIPLTPPVRPSAVFGGNGEDKRHPRASTSATAEACNVRFGRVVLCNHRAHTAEEIGVLLRQ